MCAEKIVIWGGSGHALVVADILRLRAEYEIVGFLDDVNPERKDTTFGDYRVLGGKEELPRLLQQDVKHIIFGFGDCHARLRLAELAKGLGFSLAIAIHPKATIASGVPIGPGAVIVAGSVINPGACIGENVIINTCASIDHNCVIEAGAHIGPGVHLAGKVKIGRATWVGIGSVVKDGIIIGSGSIIGAGSVVINDIPDGVVAYGVPAQVVREVSAQVSST